MKLTASSVSRTVGILAVALASVSAVQAVTLYTQNFDDTAGSGQHVLATQVPGWNVYISNKAFNMGGANAISYFYNNDATTPAPGTLQAYNISVSTTSTPGQLGGFMVHATASAAGAAGSPIMASTGTGLTIDIASYSSLDFTWKGNASLSGATSRILIQVGGQWYISAASKALTVGDRVALDSATLSLSFSPQASAWNQFTLTPGLATNTGAAGNGSMSVGATSLGDLTGTITGVGLFTAFATGGSSTTVRYDQLNISGVAAVPEPANFACLAGLAAMASLGLRRKRNIRPSA